MRCRPVSCVPRPRFAQVASTHVQCVLLLQAMDHVKGVQVDLETKLATVEVEAPTLMDAMDMVRGQAN